MASVSQIDDHRVYFQDMTCLYYFQYGTTALIWASRKGNVEIVDMLLQAAANVDTAGIVRNKKKIKILKQRAIDSEFWPKF